MRLKPGTELQNGRYRIIRVLGQGGFGITYEAEQVALRRKVALKEFFMKDYCDRDDSTSRVTLGTTAGNRELVTRFRGKFVREAQMIAGLDHPNVVKIYDVFEENGTAYYTMEYIDGGSLKELVAEKGALPEDVAVKYIRETGDALRYVHSKKVLHFDVKPSNIMLRDSGAAVLIDFGVSKHFDEGGHVTSSTPVGISKGYAPMEQYRQEDISTFTPATDIYALGATLYTLLTGEVPPDAAVVYEEDALPPMPAQLSATVRNAVAKAMSPRRKDRPQRIDDFLSLLDAKEEQKEPETEIISVQEPKPKSKPKSKPEPKQEPKPELKPKSKILRRVLVGIAAFLLLVILIGVLSPSPEKKEAKQKKPYYDSLVSECEELISSGDKSNAQPLLEAREKLVEIKRVEDKYGAYYDGYYSSGYLSGELNGKLEEARTAWEQAGDAQKAINKARAKEFYELAMQLAVTDEEEQQIQAKIAGL